MCLQLGFSPIASDCSGERFGSWGGSIWADDVDVGKWHMFAARMKHSCGINSWLTNSIIVHAVSNDVLGPYLEQDVVWDAFAHEPCVTRASDGRWVMVGVYA